MLASLRQDKPHVSGLAGCLGMIDISGYSSLTSHLKSSLGKLSSELITEAVAGYMDQIISVIYAFRGDIIKFLGDAILVCFSPSPGESDASVSKRATYCFLQIATNYSFLKVNLSKAQNDYNTMDEYTIRRGTSITSNTSNSSTVELRIHVALTFSGHVNHVIVGNVGKRLDYVVHGDCVKDLGEILDNTKEGELGISESLVTSLGSGNLQDAVLKMESLSKCGGNYIFKNESDMRTVLELLEGDVKAASHPFALEPLQEDFSISFDSSSEEYQVVRHFINESLLAKLEEGTSLIGGKNPTNNLPESEQTPARSSTVQYTTDQILHKGEFRSISIIFVKLYSEFTPERAQLATSAFVKILKKYEGVMQQYSVDDKGQTMLACFGLPPFTHEKDALYALNAAVDFGNFARATPALGKVSISVALGEILVTKLGNLSRGDTSLLGDAVNISARLLGIDSSVTGSAVKCDSETYKLTKEDFSFTSLGKHRIKGTVEPIDVWAVDVKQNIAIAKTGEKRANQSAGTLFGYHQERQILDEGLRRWVSGMEAQKICVIGQSGKGKSKLLDEVARNVLESGHNYCLSQGSEIKVNTPYSSLQNLATFIFKQYRNQHAVGSQLSLHKSVGSSKRLGGNSLVKGISYSQTSISYISKSDIFNFTHNNDRKVTPNQILVDFLIHMGESPDLAPLLKEVLPFLSGVTDNLHTKHMDGPTRQTLLKGMFVRLVKRSMADSKFVIILDDAQWFDAISLDIFAAIFHQCKDAMVYLFSRPLGDKILPAFNSIMEAPDVIKMELNGLSDKSVEELLIHKLGEFGVKKVADATLSVISAKCNGGSPLIIDTLTESIKSQLLEIFQVDSHGTLSFIDSDTETKFNTLMTLDKQIMSQFDKLCPQLQSILRVASILGQYFDLEDLYEEPFDIEQMKRIIETEDKYQFLIMCDTDDSNRSPYYFRHIQIQTAILESQPYAERAKLHLAYAERLESILTDANRDFLLPTVAYHYQRTDRTYTYKKIIYLEEIGFKAASKTQNRECSMALSQVLSIWKADPIKDFDDFRRSKWMAQLATAKVLMASIASEEFELFLEALALVGRPWSLNSKKGKKTIPHLAYTLFKLWRRTAGGTKPLPPPLFKSRECATHGSKTKEVDMLVVTCYLGLYRFGIYSDLFPKDMMGLLFFKLLTTILPHAHEERVTFAYILYLISLGVLSKVPKLAKLFFNQALQVESMMDADELEASGKSYHFKALISFSYGHLRRALNITHDLIRYHEARGDSSMTSMGYCILQVLMTQLADVKSYDEKFREQATAKVMYRSGLIKCQLPRCLLTNNFEDARKWYEMTELAVKNAQFRHYLDPVHIPVADCWKSLQFGDWDKVVGHLEFFAKPEYQLTQVHVTGYDFYLFIPHLAFLIAVPVSPNMNSKSMHKWSPSDVDRIVNCFKHLQANLELLAIKQHVDLFFLPASFLKACKLLMKGKKAKAVQSIKCSFKVAEKKRFLHDMVLIRATMRAFIALFGDKLDERQRCFQDAKKLYEENELGYMATLALIQAAGAAGPHFGQSFHSSTVILTEECRIYGIETRGSDDFKFKAAARGFQMSLSQPLQWSCIASYSSLGKLSSELITNAVAAYMDQIIAVIYAFNGDVVKFLGDAILVCFSPLSHESEEEVAQRAAYCCLHISAHFSSLAVDLTKARQDYGATGENTAYRSGTSKYSLISSGMSDNLMKLDKATLRIHVALTAGEDVEHIIVGLSEKRLDYIIYGACMRDLGAMLDSTKEGELGISSALLAKCPNSFRGAVRHLSAAASKGGGGYILKAEDDFKVFLGLLAEAQPILPNYLTKLPSKLTSLQVDSENIHPLSAPDMDGNDSVEIIYQLAKPFVNESLLYKFEARKNLGKTVKRQKSIVSTSSGYDSDSASTVVDQTIKGEFRIISIIFIKLSSEFTPKRAQAAMEAFVQILRKWEGVYQQYSVDDKGQTMLGCFGLPPYTHEKDSLYALKAALEFNSFVQKTPEIGKVSISVCTGEILFSKLGNQYRADTSLLGDAVNVAARLLSVGGGSAASSVKCDAATYKLTKEDFHHTFMGAQMVKGKAEAIDVYSVLAKDDTTKAGDLSSDRHTTTVYGYKQEREILDMALRNWDSGEQNQRVVVMGKSGIGKSALLAEISHKVAMSGYSYCLIQGSELKQNMPFVSLQNLAQFIFKRFTDTITATTTDTQASNMEFPQSPALTETISFTKIHLSKSIDMSRRNIASSSRSELLSFVQLDGDQMTPELKLVTDFLAYMGESADLAPLLSDVLPFLTITDNSHTRNMDGPTKQTLLKSMMVRFVNKSLKDGKYVIIFDDAQWLDAISLEIIAAIVHKCPDTLIYIFMRPLGDTPLPVFNSIFEANCLKKLLLNGIVETDVQDIIISKFSCFGVNKVDGPTPLCQSTGSPLIIDTLAESVRSQFDELFTVDSFGLMKLRDEETERTLEGFGSLDSFVMQQFDRKFQTILRFASVFGQYLDLEDLKCFIDEEMSIADLQRTIEEQDLYNYLVKQDEESTQMYFRHIQIQNAIYESQPYAERVQCHLNCAEYFEMLLTPANRDFLMPTISYHYQRTDKVDKKIMYLEEIGLKLHKKGHTRECISYLNMLLNVCTSSPMLEVEAHRKAGWMARLASARVQLPLMTVDEMELCMQSLKLLGRPWPGSKKELKRATLAAAWELFRLWRATNGGMRPDTRSTFFGKPGGKCRTASNARELDELALMNFMSLFRLGTYTSVFDKSNFGLLFLRKLTTSIRHASEGSESNVKFVYVLYNVSLGISTSIPRLARLFYKQGKRVEATMTIIEEKEAVVSSYHLKALVALSYSNIRESADCARSFVRYTENRGDTNMASAAYNMLQIASTQLGDLKTNDSVFERLANEKSFYKAAVAKCQLFRYLLMTNDEATDRYLKITEEAVASIAVAMPHPIHFLHVPAALCWMALRDGKFDEAIQHLEFVAKPEHQVRQIHIGAYDTYLFFPHLACMLVVPCITNSRFQSSGLGTVHKWSKHDASRISKCLEKMNVFVDTLATKSRVDVFFWPSIMVQACKLLLEGHRRKAAQKVLNAMKIAKKYALLDELVVIRGTVMAFLALVAEQGEQRERYYRQAMEVYRECGVTRLEAWLSKCYGEI
ncbi:hypothetical protein HDV05_007936 [Chytridiales sp. JEL 0842]|nr:hypothetical protein HDV05_007936 [Chytridiales sp. JEL 0842]